MTIQSISKEIVLTYTSPANATYDSGWLYTVPTGFKGIAFVESISNIGYSGVRDEIIQLKSSSGAFIKSVSTTQDGLGSEACFTYAGISGSIILDAGESVKITMPTRIKTGQLSHLFTVKVFIFRIDNF